MPEITEAAPISQPPRSFFRLPKVSHLPRFPSPMHALGNTKLGGDDAPSRRRARVADCEGGRGSSSPHEDELVRELNRMLEAALRMGGGGGVEASALLFDAAAAAGGGGGLPPTAVEDDPGLSILNLSPADAASWRLDTARRLSSVSCE